MDLHGSTSNNLASAIQSARRLRDRPVHADTLGYWTELLDHARRELAEGSTEPMLALAFELEKQLADRARWRPLRADIRGPGKTIPEHGRPHEAAPKG